MQLSQQFMRKGGNWVTIIARLFTVHCARGQKPNSYKLLTNDIIVASTLCSGIVTWPSYSCQITVFAGRIFANVAMESEHAEQSCVHAALSRIVYWEGRSERLPLPVLVSRWLAAIFTERLAVCDYSSYYHGEEMSTFINVSFCSTNVSSFLPSGVTISTNCPAMVFIVYLVWWFVLT